MIIPVITGPECILSSNYKSQQGAQPDKPVDQQQLDGQLQITQEDYRLSTKCYFDLSKLEPRNVQDLQQNTKSVRRVVEEAALRSILLERLEAQGSLPKDLRRFALKTIINTLVIPDTREHAFQILAMLPVNCTTENAFSGKRTLQIHQ